MLSHNPYFGMAMGQSQRPDTETSKIVELGVRLQQSHGKAFASEFLVRRAIPVNVIVRVLSDPPGRRRANRMPAGL
ncbi:hypothetical protein NHH82_19760 [Oxalobacteraceae bacterium OTU3REALA1]|jgi:hypothetical protein|nr:hypothetical protein NHH82_19760 [Oxalobacteraceae bacterium OTU3REALA1]